MGGQPKWHEFCARLDRMGGIEYIIGRIANGETLLGITRDLKTSRYTVWRYINLTSERAERYAKARRDGAAALAEEAIEIADGADDMHPAGVQKAKLQVDSRKWLAGVHDREGYGEQPKAAGQQINIGVMHLHALQAHGGPDAQASLPRPKQIITDAEIVEDDDGQVEQASAASEASRVAVEGAGERGPDDQQPSHEEATEVRHAEVGEQLALL